MVTLQDISIKLMKPAKDLADWKFPLSQILEEYYALLEEPCNINFGEAALVLQNSTNVYVRRIERLLNETEVLKQTFFNYEEEEIKKSMCKEKKILKKAYIDFKNFVIIDLEKDIGKHINKKHHFQEKKIKLLSHRFTQLENGVTQLCIPIQVYDVLGEVIGKKYDFRCNQSINTNGMLIDELTPYDFTCILDSYEGKNSLNSYSEPKTSDIRTSEYYTSTSLNDNESIHDELENEQNFSSMENDLSINELQIGKENVINNNCESSFANNSNLKQTKKNELKINEITKKNESKKQDTEQSIIQDHNDEKISIHNFKEMNQIKKQSQTEDSIQVNQIKKDNQNNIKHIQFETNDQIKHNKEIDIFKENEIFELNDLDNIRWKEELPNTWKRGNQTTKMSICSVNDINECDWKPMPLIQGIKHVFCDNSSILKLPDYISFLETKFGSKKRKFTSKLCERECLTKLVLRETKLLTKKNTTLQMKQKFKHLQKQEIEDFMKNFDECLNGTERENVNFRYETVTNATDLLDFRTFQNQNNSIENNTENITSRSSSPTDNVLHSIIYQNSLDTSVKSPDSSNNWCETSISDINLSYSLPDYQTLIEHKMKEIFEESNVTTELDQTVAKWHASLQPKLSEVETRPTFRIHDYSSRIIEELQTLEQKTVNFDTIVQDKPAYEVARYFLASLQLANTYNVEIKTKSNDNNIEIMLLNGKSYEEN